MAISGSANFQKLLDDYQNIYSKFIQNNAETIPLCAAESTLSDFAKSPLASSLQERYIKGSAIDFDPEKSFIGSEYIFPFYEMIQELCSTLYGCKYADARPLSGMNATISVLMSITSFGDKVLLLSSDAGGHESFPAICERLGLIVDEVPFDYSLYDIDIAATNKLLAKNDYAAIILAPSDLIFAPSLDEIIKPDETTIIYDSTQTLGLIAGKSLPNPFNQTSNVIMTGGTHKTIPGPTSGLVLINDKSLIEQVDLKVSPTYVRNPQPHQIASLVLTLIEFVEFGSSYMREVQKNANYLGRKLDEEGFSVASSGGRFTETHQIFLRMSAQESLNMSMNARKHKVTLDRKFKKLYGESGVRIGVQTITRFGWENSHLDLLAKLLKELSQSKTNEQKIKNYLTQLPRKQKLKYTVSN